MEDPAPGRTMNRCFVEVCWEQEDPSLCSQIWVSDPAPTGLGGEGTNAEEEKVLSGRRGGPSESPAEKDTESSANTFNALRIHGRKTKTFSDSQKYYKRSRAGENIPSTAITM